MIIDKLGKALYEWEMNDTYVPEWEVLDHVMKKVWIKRAELFKDILISCHLKVEEIKQ